MLEHGILTAWKYGFRINLVDPKNTSKLAEKIKEYFKLDKHTISAYTLAVKYLSPDNHQTCLVAPAIGGCQERWEDPIPTRV